MAIFFIYGDACLALSFPEALHRMKVLWLTAAEVKELSLYREEPFEEVDWWEALGESWGGLACVEGTAVQAVWLLAERRLGPLRLWRMPLAVPYAPLLMPEPLDPRAYRRQAPILKALACFILGVQWRLRWVAGSLPPEWSYYPPFWQAGLRPGLTGSFTLHTFTPQGPLRRKLRQAATIPVFPIPAEKAWQFWEKHAPAGIPPKFRQQLQALLREPLPWRLLAAGEPPAAVGFFLWGQKRVWYFAGAHGAGPAQAGTRLMATAIAEALEASKTFDFMGSVLPTIERFFQQFGGVWENRLFLQSPLLRRLSS